MIEKGFRCPDLEVEGGQPICREARVVNAVMKNYKAPLDLTCTPKDQEDCQRVLQEEWQPIEAHYKPPEDPDSTPQLRSRCYRALGGASFNRNPENQ
jgi:hypothetical protein